MTALCLLHRLSGPEKRRYRSVACRVMSGPASARETGQPLLVASAISWNFAASMPGTSASHTSAIVVMVGPPSVISRETSAVVLTRVGAWPASARPCDSAME